METPRGQPHTLLQVGPMQAAEAYSVVHTQLMETHTPFAVACDTDVHESGYVAKHVRLADPGGGSARVAKDGPSAVQGVLEPVAY